MTVILSFPGNFDVDVREDEHSIFRCDYLDQKSNLHPYSCLKTYSDWPDGITCIGSKQGFVIQSPSDTEEQALREKNVPHKRSVLGRQN